MQAKLDLTRDRVLTLAQLRASQLLDNENLLYTHSGRVLARNRWERLSNFIDKNLSVIDKIELVVCSSSRQPRNHTRYSSWEKLGQVQKPQATIWACIRA